jgi:tetratricopeptide (TPR) repeat protein
VAWLGRLEAEHDNLRAALAWSLAGGDGGGAAAALATEPAVRSSGLRLATALAEFWWLRGHIGEGRRWLAQALAAAPEVAPVLRARALLGAGLLSFWQGELAHAATFCGEGLALARTAEDRPVTAELLNNLGWVLLFQGEYRRAVALHEESLALCRALRDIPGCARALVHLGMGLLQLGDYARAEELLREAGVLAEAVSDTYGMGAATQMLGFSAAAQGDYPLAEARLREGLAVARRVGFTWGQAATVCGLGEVACRQGRLDEAATYLREGLALFREMDQQWGIAWALEGLAATRVAARAALEGARLLGVAARLREDTGAQMRTPGSSYDWAVGAARAALGDVGMAPALAEGRAMSLPHVLDAALGQTG